MDPVPLENSQAEEVVLKAPEAVEEIKREEEKKRCCKISKEARCMFFGCVRCWSLSLNGCEGCCSILSACFLNLSKCTDGCNRCLEQMDCDGH